PVDEGACGEPAAIRTRHPGRDPLDPCPFAEPARRQDASIPDGMQPFGAAEERHVDSVTAVVAVVGAVEGLMEVADQVDDEAECLGTALIRRAMVGEYSALSLERRDDAVAARRPLAVARRLVVVRGERDVDVVPAGRLGAAVTDLVGPEG